MTAFDRIELHLPESLETLAAERVPDYFDDMLRQTARTRQRPAWSSLERWLPMGVLARRALVPSLPWRSIGIVALLIVALVMGAILIAGSQHRLPPPFGLARNGAIVYSTTDGDIASVDPATGAVTAIVAGPSRDTAPLLSRDGTRFLFVRAINAMTSALVITNIDGSGVRTISEGNYGFSDFDWSPFDWSPDGTKIAHTAIVDGARMLTIVAIDGTAPRTFDLGMEVSDATWRPSGEELLIRGEKWESGKTFGFYIVRPDGTGLHPVVPPDTLEFGWRAPVLSPDGKLVAYSRWGSDEDGIHIVDIDAGVDRLLAFPGHESSDEYLPTFSPDGNRVVFVSYRDGQFQLVVAKVDGSAADSIGPRYDQSAREPFFSFSPDGTQVLATYPQDGKTWLLDPGSGAEHEVTWGSEFQSWQRLAP